MSDKSDTNKYLEKFEGKKKDLKSTDPSEVSSTDLTCINERSTEISLGDGSLESMSGKGKLFKSPTERMAGKKHKEGLEIMVNSELARLREQAYASVKEAKAFWDGKSEEVAQRIHAYVTASLSDLEVERQSHLQASIDRIVMSSNEGISRAHENEDLLEMLRDRQVQTILEEMEKSIERVREQNDSRR